MSANNSRLVVQNLQKSFKKRQVVKSFSLEIESGEVIGLLGPNGAGKTTSFYMIVGLIAADAGSVMLDGQELRHLPIHERARLGVGYLPQEASIFRKMTVEQNIRAILEISMKDKSRIDAELEKLLADLNIERLRNNPGRVSFCWTNLLPALTRLPSSIFRKSSSSSNHAVLAY